MKNEIEQVRKNIEEVRNSLNHIEPSLRQAVLDTIDELMNTYENVVTEIEKPEDIRLAELIHDKMCQHNHTDGCSWFYEKWDNNISTRKRYLDQAQAILREFSMEEAARFMELIKR